MFGFATWLQRNDQLEILMPGLLFVRFLILDFDLGTSFFSLTPSLPHIYENLHDVIQVMPALGKSIRVLIAELHFRKKRAARNG
jgi:hypothetical protein